MRKGEIEMEFKVIKKRLFHSSNSRRFIEIDLIRGFTIIMMILFHISWDLDHFGIVTLNKTIYQYNFIFQPMFFLLVGICLAVNSNKNNNLSKNKKSFKTHLIKRGLSIVGLGMIITLITFVIFPDKIVLFGVLHCIGFSIILSIPFLKFKSYNILFALLIIIFGFIIGSFTMENPTILHLMIGVHQPNLWQHTIDYFPLFPWFGVTLFGVALGNLLYTGNERRFKIPDLSKYKPAKMFSWCGKHSLAIYLLHQPIIAGTLFIFDIF